jgi:hypothetical protein
MAPLMFIVGATERGVGKPTDSIAECAAAAKVVDLSAARAIAADRAGGALEKRPVSAVRQQRRRADHTDRHEGNNPHGPNRRSIAPTYRRVKSEIAGHDLLHALHHSEATFQPQ